MSETRVVHNYLLPIHERAEIMLPKGCQILAVMADPEGPGGSGDGPARLIVLADPAAESVPRHIRIVVSGREVYPTKPGYRMAYIGSFVNNSILHHAFEDIPLEGTP